MYVCMYVYLLQLIHSHHISQNACNSDK